MVSKKELRAEIDKLKNELETLELRGDIAQDILCTALGPNHGRGNLIVHAEKAAAKIKELTEALVPEVVVISSDTDPDALSAMIDETGSLPSGARKVSYQEFIATGRAPDCDCMLLQCVCEEARQHKPNCQYKRALTLALGIACDAHGYDVCPECDACNCK